MTYSLPGPKPISVLLIDDDELLLQELSEALEAVGSVVFKLPDASKLDCKSVEVFDLMILDISMPGSDGFDIISRLSNCSRAPELILVSGFGSDVLQSARESAERGGIKVRATLSKPVDIGELSLFLLPDYHGLESLMMESGDGEAGAVVIGDVIADPDKQVFLPRRRTADGTIEGFRVAVPGMDGATRQVPPALSPEQVLLQLDTQLQASQRFFASLPEDFRILDAHIDLPLQAMLSPDIAQHLMEYCAAHASHARQTTFVLQHHSVHINDSTVLRALARLRMMEYGLALSNVGRADSALSQIAALPLTEICVDGELVRQARLWTKSAEIVMSVTTLGHRLALRVSAAGIATEQDLRLIRGAGIDVYEGSTVGPPMTATQFRDFIADNPTATGQA